MKRTLRAFICMLLSIIMCVSLAACTAKPAVDPVSGSNTDDDSNKVGIAMPTKSLERWNRDGAFLKEKFEANGYEVELVYSDNDVNRQVNDIENLIAEDVDILVVAAIDGESLSSVLDTAKEADIPVIAYDRLIMNTGAVSYYVSFDNYTVGTLQGQYVVDALGLKLDDTSKTYNIEFTAGDPADNNAKFFFNGAYDVVKDYIDAGILNVVSGQKTFEEVATASWDTKNALNRMQNILASYYSDGTQLDVALCSNDSTALGVTQAIESDYAGTNSVIITGQDGDQANMANIVDGKQSMTVYKAVANEAVVTYELSVAILSGETANESLTSKFDCACAFDTNTYDNGTGIIPSYLLTPTVVTVDNIQKELIDTGYYEWDSDNKYPLPKN